jgi:hypothetical protein
MPDARRGRLSPLLDIDVHPRVRDADQSARSRSIAASEEGVSASSEAIRRVLLRWGEWLLLYFSAVRTENLISQSLAQASDLRFLVGVAGFEPTASSSRTAGRAVNGGYFRRSPASGGRCGPVLVGGVAVLRSCTAALAAQGWDWPWTGETD